MSCSAPTGTCDPWVACRRTMSPSSWPDSSSTDSKSADGPRSGGGEGDVAERVEQGGERVAAGERDRLQERTREDDVPCLHRHAELAELVGEPHDGVHGIPHHRGGEAAILAEDVLVDRGPLPAQVEVRAPPRSPSYHHEPACPSSTGSPPGR